MIFKNPVNGYVEESNLCWLWCLLFGFTYFAYKGAWGHSLISLILALCTAGISNFIYPFFATSVVRKHYLQKGWREVQTHYVEEQEDQAVQA
mgnify:CR=1 FL=1